MWTCPGHNFGCGAPIKKPALFIEFEDMIEHWCNFEGSQGSIRWVLRATPNLLILDGFSIWQWFSMRFRLVKVNRSRLDFIRSLSIWNSVGGSVLSWSLMIWSRLNEMSALTGYSDAFSVTGCILARSMNVTLWSSGCLRASEGLNDPSISMFSDRPDLKLHPSEFEIDSDPETLEISVWSLKLTKIRAPKNVNLSGP